MILFYHCSVSTCSNLLPIIFFCQALSTRCVPSVAATSVTQMLLCSVMTVTTIQQVIHQIAALIAVIMTRTRESAMRWYVCQKHSVHIHSHTHTHSHPRARMHLHTCTRTLAPVHTYPLLQIESGVPVMEQLFNASICKTGSRYIYMTCLKLYISYSTAYSTVQHNTNAAHATTVRHIVYLRTPSPFSPFSPSRLLPCSPSQSAILKLARRHHGCHQCGIQSIL